MGGDKSKQRNKGHKHGKHASKGELKQRTKGRVAALAAIPRKMNPKAARGGLDSKSKHIRIQQQQARVANHRETMLALKRIGKQVPKLVGFIPMDNYADQLEARKALEGSCGDKVVSCGWDDNAKTLVSSAHRQLFTFMHSADDLQSQIDLAKVADILVLVCRVNTDEEAQGEIEPDLPDDKSVTTAQTWYSDIGLSIDDAGRQLISVLNGQGVPSICVVLQGLQNVASAKKRRRIEKVHLRYFQSIFSAELVTKVFCCDTVEKAALALRYISEAKVRQLHWREGRPYFLAEDCRWMSDEAEPYEGPDGGPCKDLRITGYLRGQPLSANQLVHLTGYGTYQIAAIYNSSPSPSGPPELGDIIDEPTDEQEALQYCQEPDMTNNEQTWPTEEELAQAEAEERKRMKELMTGGKIMKVKVPAGFSSYQAAWVANPEDFEEASDEDNPAPMDYDFDRKSRATTMVSRATTAQTDVEDIVGGEWLAKDEALSPEEREQERQRLKEASAEDKSYPDEVEAPVHIPARVRFQKYRGMASFRQTEWDPNENLPLDYARIYQFQNFRQTQNAAKEAMKAGKVQPDSYITVVLRGVPVCFMQQAQEAQNCPIVASGLLRHEQKYTLLHFILQRNKEFTEPVKSKTRLVMHVGFRKIVANPIFSEPCKGSRTKFCRYYHADDRFIMASAFGPTTYPSAPVLCFLPITRREKEEGSEMPLVAFGTTEQPNPNMLLLKKIVLTGHVFKTHKRQSIVRFMFHNEDDVKHFQSVELYTKLGYRGKILKSVGTHGHMKCSFSGIVQGHDVVCMDLWKRVFPKWTTAAYSKLAESPQDEASSEADEEGEENMGVDPIQ